MLDSDLSNVHAHARQLTQWGFKVKVVALKLPHETYEKWVIEVSPQEQAEIVRQAFVHRAAVAAEGSYWD